MSMKIPVTVYETAPWYLPFKWVGLRQGDGFLRNVGGQLYIVSVV